MTAPLKHAVLIGLGNIGSFALELLARIPEIGRITLVDPDSYAPGNLGAQRITPADIGRPKVEVNAERLALIAPHLVVNAIQSPVEDVPPGCLRADILLACVDSRAARIAINRTARRLAVPRVLDAAVDGEQQLARLTVTAPGAACLECTYTAADYHEAWRHERALCAHTSIPTAAPAHLGSFIASLQAMECAKYLAGDPNSLKPGAEVLVDLAHHNHYVTNTPVNPHCQFDHASLTTTPINADPRSTTLAQLLNNRSLTTQLGVEGKPFATRVVCDCGASAANIPPTLAHRIQTLRGVCSECAQPLGPGHGIHLHDTLHADTLDQSRCAGSLGLLPGDILTLTGTTGNRSHIEFIVHTPSPSPQQPMERSAEPCHSQ